MYNVILHLHERLIIVLAMFCVESCRPSCDLRGSHVQFHSFQLKVISLHLRKLIIMCATQPLRSHCKFDVVPLCSLTQLAKSSLERRLHEAERRLAFRPRPTSASREELLFRIDQLQREQGEWRKKVEDLEALNSHYLKEKLELAQDRNALEQKLQVRGCSQKGGGGERRGGGLEGGGERRGRERGRGEREGEGEERKRERIVRDQAICSVLCWRK